MQSFPLRLTFASSKSDIEMMHNMEIQNQGLVFSPRQYARMASWASLVMFVAAMVAEFYGRQRLIVVGDRDLTAHNMLANGASFRVGLFCFLVVMICDAIVAWAFASFFKRVHPGLAQLSGWLRLLYTAMFGVLLLCLVMGYKVIVSANALPAAAAQQQGDFAMQLFEAFEYGWSISFLFFGMHLLCIGYLILKSGFVPKWIGFVLLLAGSTYLLNNMAQLILPNYEDYKAGLTAAFAIPSIVGELGIAIWLLFWGGKGSHSMQ